MRDRQRLRRAVTENIRAGITFRRDDVAFTIRVRGKQRTPILSNMHLLSWGGESINAETPGDSIISCITYNFTSFGRVMVHSHEDEPCLLIVDWEPWQVSKMSVVSIVPDGRNSETAVRMRRMKIRILCETYTREESTAVRLAA
jgi:hypothetical protein